MARDLSVMRKDLNAVKEKSTARVDWAETLTGGAALSLAQKN